MCCVLNVLAVLRECVGFRCVVCVMCDFGVLCVLVALCVCCLNLVFYVICV